MKMSTTLLAALGLAALAVASPAVADDKGIYLGGSFGLAQFGDSCDDVALLTGNTGGCQDKDEAWRAFAGYRFNKTVAVELGFADLGRVTAQGAAQSVEAERRSWDLSALFSLPITERLSAFGRLGVYLAKTSLKLVAPAGTSESGETNSGFSYGAGLGYQLGFLGLRTEWQRWDNVGGGTTGEDTIDLFSVGVLIQF